MIRLENINMNYGKGDIFSDLTFKIEKNKVTTIIGESGCGKTTILNIIAGIVKTFRGDIISDEDIEISYMFQESRLLPWKTVYENIRFVLKDNVPENQVEDRIAKALEIVNMQEHRNEYPNNLSGGMKQRVALARSIAFPSNIILMDEPFSGLDYYRKVQLIDDFNRMVKDINKTIILVTHDITAALMFSDKIILLGNRPTEIIEEYEVGVERQKRDILSKEIKDIEDQIYSSMRKLSRG
ncbi:MAG: ABC transporter ATP-binding protein [Firmicutes bacterium]|jgi:NitT/TauT family transport system ATP-binding protein|nr:ABC transporter ATP-binding protein [Bacillota bacterium]